KGKGQRERGKGGERKGMALFAETAVGTNDSTMVDELPKWIAKKYSHLTEGFLLSLATDFTHAGPSILNLCKTTHQNTQPRTAACEGTNISRAGHTNIVENAQAVCKEPINSVCLHTRDSNDVVPLVLTWGKGTCQNTQASRLADKGAFVIVLGIVHNAKIVHIVM
ncbi:hypothetical protein Tco_1206670, partial [Tanacetum coccineum]